MIKTLIAEFGKNVIPANAKFSLSENCRKLYATFDVKDVYKEGDLVMIWWNNPAHEGQFQDKCICAIHVKDDPKYSGKNFLYIVKGSYVDMSPYGEVGLARQLNKDCIGIAESEIDSIRSVNNYERSLFFDCLHANMLDYNVETHKIVPYEVHPILGANYYVVVFRKDNTEGFEFTKGEYEPHKFTWTDKSADTFKGDVIFDSLEGCEEACRKLNEAIKRQSDIIMNITKNGNE